MKGLRKIAFSIGLVFLMSAYGFCEDNSLIVNESGNVGIGTDNPASALHIVSAAGGHTIRMERGPDSWGFLLTGSDEMGLYNYNTSRYLWFAEKDGNIGIGTTTPASLLEVRENQNAETQLSVLNTNSGSNARASISVGYSDGYGLDIFRKGNSPDIFFNASQGSGNIRFQDAGVDTLTISSSRNVGIGVTAPSSLLEVRKNQNAETQLSVLNTNSGSSARASISVGYNDGYGLDIFRKGNSPDIFFNATQGSGNIRFQDAGADTLTISSSRNVGIGKIAPSYKLDVNGSIRCVNVSTSSDIRFKTNIMAIENSLDKLSKLRGVTYEWTDPSRGVGDQIGVIAQEVEEVFPEVVSTDNEGYKSVAYAKLVSPLIEAVKELKKENENLKNELLQLKQIVGELSKKRGTNEDN